MSCNDHELIYAKIIEKMGGGENCFKKMRGATVLVTYFWPTKLVFVSDVFAYIL